MPRYQIWNGTDNLYTPVPDQNGRGAWTPGDYITAHAPWMNNPAAKAVITTGVINCAVFQEFEMTKDFILGRICAYLENQGQNGGDNILTVFPDLSNLDIDWTDNTASANALVWWAGVLDTYVLALMEWLEDNPPVAPPSAEERMAAALEFQNLMSLPDVTS